MANIKKVLILSCGTGEGHNSAARAVGDALAEKGIEFNIIDPISLKSERAKKIVSSLYNNVIRKTPRIFGAVYKIGGLFEKTGVTSPVYYANRTYSELLETYITENNYDTVICTHLYGMEAMTALKKKGFTVPTYGVLTDYTCIPFVAETEIDKYFIPSEALTDEVMTKGVPREKIFASGIPTAKKFSVHISKEEARDILGMPQKNRVYLAATGGVGCEKMMGFCDELLKAENGDFNLYVLTGKNVKMKERLDSKYIDDPHIVTVSFTKDVNLYMRAADVMITKPGGLSTTEAAVANVPLVHVHEIPGCETKNVAFFSERGMSVRAKNSKEAVEHAVLLANDKERSSHMLENQKKYIPCDASESIVKEIERISEYCVTD